MAHFKQQISTFDVFCLSAGVMISSGIFILPGLAFAKAGPAVFLAYGLAGLTALMGVLSMIELSTAMPKAGGDYFFITRSFGPVLGLIIGFFSWFALSLKTAFAIFGIGEMLHALTGGPSMVFAIVVTLFFTWLNIRGVGTAVKFETAIVLALLLIMGIYIVTGFDAVQLNRFMTFAPHGKFSIFLTAGFVFVSFGGLLKIATLGSEVKNPGKAIPIGVIGSTLVVTVLYALLLFVIVGTIEGQTLTSSLTPVADSAQGFLGTPGFMMISTAAALAFISTANAGILSASRYPVALSHDLLLPGPFNRLHQKYKTPAYAIAMTALLIVVSLFLELETLVKIASSIILFSYILTNIAVIIIRESKIQNYQPIFKVPFYPVIQIISITLFAFLLFQVGVAAIETIAVIIAISLLMYLFYGRKKYDKEYALLYLIERMINKKISSDNLEDELKEILKHRDQLITDRFHRLVEDCRILDLQENMTREELFTRIASDCAVDFNLSSEKLLSYLHEREDESSTALTPFLAIPHLIVEGNGIFKMIVIRVRQGVAYSETFKSVKAIFVLVGSRDERQFHLQALSAIAQITHNANFEANWLNARTMQNLKDLLLLSHRKRHSHQE